jgi:hypothetical protein
VNVTVCDGVVGRLRFIVAMVTGGVGLPVLLIVSTNVARAGKLRKGVAKNISCDVHGPGKICVDPNGTGCRVVELQPKFGAS